MKTNSTRFLIKTNTEVDAWMDSFYTDGHKADFRLHCQWAWQEQERRKASLIEALKMLESTCGDGLPIDHPARVYARDEIAKAESHHGVTH